MSSKPSMDHAPRTRAASWLAGFRAAATSVFSLVLIGTYVGVGALGHNYGFSLAWVLLSTLLVWAGPAQVILISTLGAGAPPLEAAVAVGLSGLRLLPTVPREERIAFANGLGCGFLLAAHGGAVLGYYLAASFPPLLTAGLLFLTPMAFLASTA